jgi:hypothetical protein
VRSRYFTIETVTGIDLPASAGAGIGKLATPGSGDLPTARPAAAEAVAGPAALDSTLTQHI